MFVNRRISGNSGVSTTEYIAMIMIVIAALFFFQKYFVRGFAGHWKGVGDSYGYGRQYDPRRTRECMFDMSVNVYVDFVCYRNCQGTCDSTYGTGANKVCEAACSGTCATAECQSW